MAGHGGDDAGNCPPCAAPEPGAVPQTGVTVGLTLRVVAQFVLSQQANRPCQANLHAQPSQVAMANKAIAASQSDFTGESSALGQRIPTTGLCLRRDDSL